MDYTSKAKEEIEKLKEKIYELEGQLEKEKECFEAAKVAAGWQKFSFFSSYYGSHPEYDGDKERVYLFHPSLDVAQWERVCFAHGGQWREIYPQEIADVRITSDIFKRASVSSTACPFNRS